MNEIEDIKRRLEDLKETMFEKDMEAGGILEAKAALIEEWKPLNAGIYGMEQNLIKMSLEKEVLLMQYMKGVKTLIGLESEEASEGYIQ